MRPQCLSLLMEVVKLCSGSRWHFPSISFNQAILKYLLYAMWPIKIFIVEGRFDVGEPPPKVVCIKVD